MRHIKFFDTTMRDGEQAPGFSMKTDEKVKLALQLEKLGVDIIEAGFPASSTGDFEAVQKVASVITKSTIAGLCRSNKNDISRAWEALKDAKFPRLHIFIATSDIHLHSKLKKTREEVLEIAREMVSYGASLCPDVEFSAEDAIRTDKDYLCKVIETAINAGAKTVNIPDTVGYTVPEEYANLIKYVREHVPNIDKATISVHCHNDLGLAVANSLAAVGAGACQVECAVNGIGERAGNAALEEIAMALNVRKDLFSDVKTNINTAEIYPTSRLLSAITGVDCQPNKAIVGKNAFAHEAGIHQDGVLKNPFTYEIMTPESVGFPKNKLVLGKHSGRHAFVTRLADLGFTNIAQEKVEELFTAFKVLADKKKEVFDEDLEALVYSGAEKANEAFKLNYICFASGSQNIPTATVVLQNAEGITFTDASTGDGPIDASYKAIERLTGISGKLENYRINAITSGTDAQGEVIVSVVFNGAGESVNGRGYSTDVLVASVNAYMDALNKYIRRNKA